MPWGNANLEEDDDQNDEEEEDCEERQQLSNQAVVQQQQLQYITHGQISEEHAKLLMMQMMGYVGTGGINGPSLGYQNQTGFEEHDRLTGVFQPQLLQQAISTHLQPNIHQQ